MLEVFLVGARNEREGEEGGHSWDGLLRDDFSGAPNRGMPNEMKQPVLFSVCSFGCFLTIFRATA